MQSLRFSLSLSVLVFVASATAEDWERLAEATDEPGYAVRIDSLAEGGQLESLGLRVGDYIYQVGDLGVRKALRKKRDGDEVIYYCRVGGKKETGILKPGRYGGKTSPVFRPQIDYLRGVIGKRGNDWDESTVAALALLSNDAKAAEVAWNGVKAAGYPNDELDAFVRAYCAARLGREIPVQAAFEAVDGEFSDIPPGYFAHLEEMAYASGQTDLLRRLQQIDPGSSEIEENLLGAWERFDASPVGPARLLERAVAARGRDLRNELTTSPHVSESRRKSTDRNLPLLQKGDGYLNPPPGGYSFADMALPLGEDDFHFSVTVRLAVSAFHEKWDPRVRIAAFIAPEHNLPILIGSFLLVPDRTTRLTRVNYHGGYDNFFHERLVPQKQIPVHEDLATGEKKRLSPTFRIDFVRYGREMAIYLDGESLVHMPIDRDIPTDFLELSASGVLMVFTDFQVWGLKPGG